MARRPTADGRQPSEKPVTRGRKDEKKKDHPPNRDRPHATRHAAGDSRPDLSSGGKRSASSADAAARTLPTQAPSRKGRKKKQKKKKLHRDPAPRPPTLGAAGPGSGVEWHQSKSSTSKSSSPIRSMASLITCEAYTHTPAHKISHIRTLTHNAPPPTPPKKEKGKRTKRTKANIPSDPN